MRKTKLAIAMLVLSAQVATGQADTTNKHWSLQECVELAATNNLTIKKAILTKEESMLSYWKTSSSRLPNLSFSMSDRITYGTSIDPITSDFLSQTINSTSAGLSSSMTLYSGQKLTNQTERSRLQVEQNCLYIEEAKQNVSLNLAEAYIQVLYSKDNINIYENTYNRSLEELERDNDRFEAGSLAKTNLVETESQVATDLYKLQSAEITYKQNLMTLKQLLEIPTEQEFEISELDTNYINGWIIPDKETLYQQAASHDYGLAAKTIQKDIDEKSLAIAKGGYYPTLSMSGSMSTGATNSRDDSFGDQLHGNFSTSVGISLNVPIFNRNQTKADVMSAKLNMEATQINMSQAEKDLRNKIEKLWFSANSSYYQMTAAEKTMESLLKSYELVEDQYTAGMATRLTLTQSRDNYLSARQNYLQAKYMTILYKILIVFYTGETLDI